MIVSNGEVVNYVATKTGILLPRISPLCTREAKRIEATTTGQIIIAIFTSKPVIAHAAEELIIAIASIEIIIFAAASQVVSERSA